MCVCVYVSVCVLYDVVCYDVVIASMMTRLHLYLSYTDSYTINEEKIKY